MYVVLLVFFYQAIWINNFLIHYNDLIWIVKWTFLKNMNYFVHFLTYFLKARLLHKNIHSVLFLHITVSDISKSSLFLLEKKCYYPQFWLECFGHFIVITITDSRAITWFVSVFLSSFFYLFINVAMLWLMVLSVATQKLINLSKSVKRGSNIH